jgi:hypothetical protein
LPVDSANVHLDLLVSRLVSFKGRYQWWAFMDDWKKQLDLLVEETLLFIRSVGGDASKKIDFAQTVAPPESQGVVRRPEPAKLPLAVEVSSSKVRSDREGDEIHRRVANFKANQKKFQKDREEYYTRTMADARATQLSPRKQ